MVFARDLDAGLTSLVKKLDAEVAKNKSANMRAFVVFMKDGEEELKKAVEAFQKKEGIKNVSLAIDNPAGPPKPYAIAKEAQVTVVLYKGKKVASNHAFGKGELNDKGVDAILADVPKIIK